MVKNASAWVYGDRLGSIGKFYPYGQERPSATQNGTEKFTGYLRDAETGLDYADQRYEQPGTGRFLTPDPAESGDIENPGSLNLYAYVEGDPVNSLDPDGTTDFPISPGGSPNSCFNHTLAPWLNSVGYRVTTSFDQFAYSTNVGVLAVTLYYEDAHASTNEWDDIAQVMANRYNLGQTNSALAKQLGLPTGSIPYVIEHSSGDWASSGRLNSGDVKGLKTLLDDPVVGASNATAAGACNQLLSAMETAYNAVSAFNGNSGRVGGTTSGVSTNTYWFYKNGTSDPVNHNFWDTNYPAPVGPFTFENLLGPHTNPAPKPPPIRKRPGKGKPIR